MIKAPYVKGENFDLILNKIIKDISNKLNVGQDDFLLLCCGTTGTGKSMLMLHAAEAYMGKEANIDYIGLDKADFAKAQKLAKEKALPRFCANDEANISKRNSLSTYNKDLIDLYLSNRGQRIFHWWSNPSLDLIDKQFIEERIKGVIYIISKDINIPRVYYYFRKEDMLKIWDKYGNLKLKLLKKIRKEYAYYRGWFKDYNGFLREAYDKKKEIRMSFKSDDFYEKYGNQSERITTSAAARALALSITTLKKNKNEMLEKGLLNEDDIIRAPTGYLYFKKDCLPKIERYASDKHRKAVDKIN